MCGGAEERPLEKGEEENAFQPKGTGMDAAPRRRRTPLLALRFVVSSCRLRGGGGGGRVRVQFGRGRGRSARAASLSWGWGGSGVVCRTHVTSVWTPSAVFLSTIATSFMPTAMSRCTACLATDEKGS